MAVSFLLGFAGLAAVSAMQGDTASTFGVPQETAVSGTMETSRMALIMFVFFIISVGIAILSVMTGIGGGVIFTPIMLAFTNINSLIVRGAGLIVAMFSAPVSAGVFIKKGLANYRLILVMTLSQALGALAGANLAIAAASIAGESGEGLMRLGLGALLLFLAAYFISGGKKLEYPVNRHIGAFTENLRLGGRYFEESEKKTIEYSASRAPLGIVLLFFVGVLGGFFGMGGGWAIAPSLNLGMGLPLKIAAANSGIILGIGSCASIWPYVFAGGIIPLFALPWAAGQVVGGFIGSYALARIKVRIVRFILIGIMIFTSFGLLAKGLEMLNAISGVPQIVHVALFCVTLIATVSFIFYDRKKNAIAGSNAGKNDAGQSIAVDGVSAISFCTPKSQAIFGGTLYWISIIFASAALLIPIAVFATPQYALLNQNAMFYAIFDGANPAGIWSMSRAGGFPGAHLYIKYFAAPDGWAMLLMNIGCAAGLFGLAPAAIYQIAKEKDRFCAMLGFCISILIVLSMAGILSIVS